MGLTMLHAQNNIEVQGEIITDSIWTSDIDTVKVIGDIFVDTLGSLTIESGVVVEFQSAYKIDVEGSIVSSGSEADPVVFTVSDTTGYFDHSMDGWLGIDFVNTDENADSSIFKYTEFYFGHADGSDYYDTNGGAIFIEYFNKVKAENCLFKYNYSTGGGGAIHVKDADILVQNSTFESNECEDSGGAMNVTGNEGTCTAMLFHNTFQYNIALAGGALRVRGGGNSIISGNNFQFNKAFDTTSESGGGGVLVTGDPDSTLIENNFVTNNIASDGGGIKIAGYSSPVLINNIIVNNTVSEYEGDSYTGNGGGIKIAYYANPIIINNTIANNLADYGGGIFTSCNIDSVKVYNTIIYGNVTSGDGAQVYINTVDEDQKIEFNNCNIEGDTTDIYIESGDKVDIVYQNNMDTLSYFADATDGAGAEYETNPEDWMLLGTSPNIEAGDVTDLAYLLPDTDYFGNKRTIAGTIDIGAHEFGLVREISIHADAVLITENEGTLQLSATVTPDDATVVSVVWSVIDGTATATINQDGLLTATGALGGNGTVTVRATANDGSNVYDEIEITISNQYTGINDLSSVRLNVYPNPARDFIYLEFDQQSDFLVHVIDMTGRIVISDKVYEEKGRIDISELSDGLYFIKVGHQSESFTSRFIKQ